MKCAYSELDRTKYMSVTEVCIYNKLDRELDINAYNKLDRILDKALPWSTSNAPVCEAKQYSTGHYIVRKSSATDNTLDEIHFPIQHIYQELCGLLTRRINYCVCEQLNNKCRKLVGPATPGLIVLDQKFFVT